MTATEPYGSWLAAVRERHVDGAVHSEIVAVPTDGGGDPTVLVAGNDFYAAPRISPEGATLAWLSWDHPAMPWDHTVLSTGALDGRRVTGTRTAVDDAGAVFQPEWSPDDEQRGRVVRRDDVGIGRRRDDSTAWSERAPIEHVHAITAPLLLLQGEEDQIVPPSQAGRMVEGLDATGTPYAYVTLPGEQHGFRRAGSIRRALEVELGFYAHVWSFAPADEIEPVEVHGRE